MRYGGGFFFQADVVLLDFIIEVKYRDSNP